MGIFASVGTICLATVATLAQAAPAPPSFEVASVKIDTHGGHDWSVRRGLGGRFEAENIPLNALMAFAYNIRDQQLSGYPEWTSELRFDITATPDRPVPVGRDGDATLKLMVQTLLSDRFHLEMHRDKSEVSGFALILGKEGPRLARSAPDAIGPNITTGIGQIQAGKVKMNDLARVLSDQLGQAVVDETGLTADYDFKVEFTSEPLSAAIIPAETQKMEDAGNRATSSEGLTIFAAIQEVLGLKLVSRKVPIEVLVIDHVERPTEN